MLHGFATHTLLPLLLRAALAVVFIYHGLQKIEPDNGYGLRWHSNAIQAMADKAASSGQPPDPSKSHQPLPGGVQLAVGWGELMAGVGIALGLLTRIAALGIITIMAGAIATVTGRGGFGAPGGFEYNFVLIIVALCLIITGAGTLSLDRVIRVKMKGPATY
jgi:uncharacterized membrane protein YphA (DoxX/SURF4 family)